jgi:hypothetical protein
MNEIEREEGDDSTTTYEFSVPAELFFSVCAATEAEARVIANHIAWSNQYGIDLAELESVSGAKGRDARVYVNESPLFTLTDVARE